MTDASWWAVPSFMMASFNLVMLYRLGAPVSLGSRVARTLGLMSCLAAIFTIFEPQWQVTWLSELSYMLLFASYTAQNTQFLFEERKDQRKVEPTKPHEKFVAAMVQPSAEHKETTR